MRPRDEDDGEKDDAQEDRCLQGLRISRLRQVHQVGPICGEVPMEISPEVLRYRRGDRRTLDLLYTELGFVRVLADIPLAQPCYFLERGFKACCIPLFQRRKNGIHLCEGQRVARTFGRN